MSNYKFPSYPRSEKEARARVNRKLKSLDRRAFQLLMESAGMFEEGSVSSSIDNLLNEIRRGIDDVKEAMNEEVERAQQRRLEEDHGY